MWSDQPALFGMIMIIVSFLFQQFGMKPNLVILKNMLLLSSSTNFVLLADLMREMNQSEIEADEEFLRLLKHKLIVSKERLVSQVRKY